MKRTPVPYRLALLLVLGIVLAGCQAVPHPPSTLQPAAGPVSFPAGQYRALAQRGPVYVVDSDASSVRIYAYRAGPLASLGHNHVVAAQTMQGAIFLPGDPSNGRFDLVLPVQRLELDRPEWRRQTAGEFNSRLSDGAIAGTRRHMLGKAVLDAERYPRIAIRATSVQGELPVLDVTADVVLHGVKHSVQVPVWVQRDGDRITVEGQFRLRQTDFGIQPYSAAGGALQVADDLGIHFRLVAERRRDPFPASGD